jgi:hypothetical protein
MPQLSGSLFTLPWLLIVGVSVHDGFLVLANRSSMAAVERNPVGRLLINWNGGDIWLLLAVKAAGTVLAAAVLLVVFETRPAVGWPVCVVIAGLQLVLLMFLYLA